MVNNNVDINCPNTKPLQNRCQCGQRIIRTKCIKGSTHDLGDKQDFDVSSEGPSSGISRGKFENCHRFSDEGPSLETSKSCLSPRYSESIL